MKNFMFFCIPAHGHTNPMLPVAAELVKRGNIVRFYSFDEFEEKIRATGADFISCDSFLPTLTEQEEASLLYVLCSRAKKNIYLFSEEGCFSTNGYHYEATQDLKQYRFKYD